MASIQQELPPLLGDVKRQAIDSLLGYDYQIWRTVEAWMHLSSEEVLYIECSEDFDVMSPESASMVQVKNSPIPITINSAEVIAAILNFWVAKNKNNKKKIALKFLTRGGIGHEKKHPFGDDRGLDLWKLAAAGDEIIAKKLAKHLATTLTESSLVSFLGASNHLALVDGLFKCIEWVTSEPSIEAVKLSVRRMAIQRGRPLGLTADICSRAVASLLDHCRDAAIQREPERRSLTTEDLDLVFAKSTSISIPLTNDIQAALSSMFNIPSNKISFQKMTDDGVIPQLPEKYLPRPNFVGEIIQALNESSTVLLAGAEGMGKTTIANIAGRSLSDTRWVDVSAYQGDALIGILEDACVSVRGASRPKYLILDDVPISQGLTDQIWPTLQALLESCCTFCVGLLLTAKNVDIGAVDSKLRTFNVKVFPVPNLTQNEVELFFKDLACPDVILPDWARTTLAQSGGHPKLVYLRGRELSDNKWPELTKSEALKVPFSIEEARANTRQIANRVVSSDDRPLLYTLNLSASPFDRGVALNVGEKLSLTEPGEAFDRLVGRWVENRGRKSFSVTNMLKGQTSCIWGAEKICKAHQLLFDAFTEKRQVNVGEVAGVFIHAIGSEDPERVASILLALLAIDLETRPDLVDALSTLLILGRSPLSFAISFDSKCSTLLRMIQFQLAKIWHADQLPDIVESWAWEISKMPLGNERSAATVIKGATISLACAAGVEFPPVMAVNALKDAMVDDYQDIDISLKNLIENFRHNINGQHSLFNLIFWAIQTNYHTSSQICDLLIAMNGLDPSVRKAFLDAFMLAETDIGGSMLRKLWLSELKKECKDWKGVISTLDKATHFSTAWECSHLADESAMIISIIYDEELGEPKTALDIINARLSIRESFFLKEQKGNILFRAGEMQEALELWRESVGDGEELGKSRNIFTMRAASIVSSGLGLHEGAASWMQRAAEVCKSRGLKHPFSVFYIDSAYCWFKSGDYYKMIGDLISAATSLKISYNPVVNFYEFAAQKNALHTSLWILDQLSKSGSVKVPEPSAGYASSTSLEAAYYESLPPSSYVNIAITILEISDAVNLSHPDLSILRGDLDGTSDFLVDFKLKLLDSIRKIKENKMDGMPVAMADLLFSCNKYLDSRNANDASKEDREARLNIVMPGINLGLILDILMNKKCSFSVSDWRAMLHGHPCCSQIRPIADDLFPILNDAAINSSSKMSEMDGHLSGAAAAAHFLAGENRTPFDTAYAQIHLLNWIQQNCPTFIDSCLGRICDEFLMQWHQLGVDFVTIGNGPATERLLCLISAIARENDITLPANLTQYLKGT